MKKILILLILLLVYLTGYSQQAMPLSSEDQATVDRFEEMITFYLNNEDYTNAVAHISKIAFIYWDNQRVDKTIEYFLRTIPIYEELYDLENILKVYSNIGLIYLDLEDVVSARRNFERSLEVRRQTGNTRHIASGLIDLAYVVSIVGDNNRAVELLNEAEQIAQENNHQSLLLAVYNQLSINYDRIGIIAKSDEYRQKFLTHRDYLATQTLREGFERRETESQVEIRRTQAERRAQELEMQLQQLIFSEEQDAIRLVVAAKEDSLRLAEQRDSIVQLEMRQLEADRELQQALLERQEERQRAQRVIISYGVGVLIIGAFLLIILFRSNKAKQKANKKLEMINKEIESKSKQLQEAYYKIEDQNLKITHSINYAKEIQKALFPPRDTLKKYLPESFIFFKPLHTVSGDFYWFKEIDMNSEDDHHSTVKKPDKLSFAEKEEHNPLITKAKKKTAESRSKIKVLYVEDKVVNQKIVSLFLQSLGCEVVTANNGQEALDKYSIKEKFDLILMDIQMPVMDGITTTEKLRSKYKSLPPIIGLSANAFAGDRKKYMSLGLDEYLTKPVSEEDLAKMLELYKLNGGLADKEEIDDFLPIKGEKFIISAVDCTGHGVPGAFMSMIGYNLLDEITHHGITNSDEILKNLHLGIRRTLKQEEGTNRDGMDLSLCVINKEQQTLEFSGAQTSIIYIQNGEAKIIKGDRMSIGGVQKEMERNFSKKVIRVDKPTWFYIFSDGYIDQFGGPKNRKLLLKNFKTILLDIYKEPMDIQEKMLNQHFFEWKREEEQIDDVLVIGFKLGGNGLSQ